MSFHDMSEAEKAEYVRRSIVRFLPSTLIGLALGLGGYFAYDAYDETRTRYNIEASAAYTKFVEGDWIEQDFADQTPEEAGRNIERGEELLSQFPDHFYANLTRFILARLRLVEKDYDSAIGYLERVLAHDHDLYTTDLARYRLAQLHQLKGQGPRAIEYLDKITVPALKSVVADLRGDIFLRAFDFEQAYENWQDAVEHSSNDALKRYLRVKLDFVESIPPSMAQDMIREGLAAQAEAENADADAATDAATDADKSKSKTDASPDTSDQ